MIIFTGNFYICAFSSLSQVVLWKVIIPFNKDPVHLSTGGSIAVGNWLTIFISYFACVILFRNT